MWQTGSQTAVFWFLGFGAFGRMHMASEALGPRPQGQRVQHPLGLRWGEFSIFTLLISSRRSRAARLRVGLVIA